MLDGAIIGAFMTTVGGVEIGLVHANPKTITVLKITTKNNNLNLFMMLYPIKSLETKYAFAEAELFIREYRKSQAMPRTMGVSHIVDKRISMSTKE